MALAKSAQVYLLSFPHSGNHWVRFIVEYITGRPTLGCKGNPKDVPICQNQFPDAPGPLAHVSPDANPALHKAHYVGELASRDVDRLVLILRDYKECIAGYPGGARDSKSLTVHILNYLHNIRYFSNFEGPKAVIYYEDLLLDPYPVLQKIAEVIPGCDETSITKFLADIKYLNQQSASATGRVWRGIRSNYEISYHFGKLNEQWRNEFTRFFRSIVERSYPHQKKYISRYFD